MIEPTMAQKLAHRRNCRIFHVIMCLVMGGLSIAFYSSPISKSIESSVVPLFYNVRGSRPVPEDVVVVKIDDRSYQDLKTSTNWPISRNTIADALEKIVAAKPRLLLVNAKFSIRTPGESEPYDRIEKALQSVPSAIWNDSIVVDPGEVFHSSDAEHLPAENRYSTAAKFQLPMPLFRTGSTIDRFANSFDENTSLLERVPATYALTELAGMKINLPGPNDRINYYEQPGALHRISLMDILGTPSQEISKRLEHKIVIMGYESEQYGRGFTPSWEFQVPISAGGDMRDTEIHATVFGNLIDGTWIKGTGDTWTPVVFTLCIMGLTLCMIAGRTNLPFIGAVLAYLAIITCNYLLFAYYNISVYGVGSFALMGLLVLPGLCAAGIHLFIWLTVDADIRGEAWNAAFGTSAHARSGESGAIRFMCNAVLVVGLSVGAAFLLTFLAHMTGHADLFNTDRHARIVASGGSI